MNKKEWSLFKKKEEITEEKEYSLSSNSKENSKENGIFSFSGEKLEPLKFSNGKTQEDVVHEVLDAIEKGNKTIFIHGVCGTGKSAIALNLARHFKKSSIVVPIKSLQNQYEKDYTQDKFILKENGNRLKIAVVKGRNNFKCIFSGGNADDDELPCKIEIREKNMNFIKDYIEKNPYARKEDFSSIEDVRRMSVAPACPYWSPLLPSDANSKALEKARKKTYMACSDVEYALFKRSPGCGYYEQFESYIDADVLIFNSQKYLLEAAMGRKPKTEIEIIDECDEFLDNFSNERTINLSRLLFSVSNLSAKREQREILKDIIYKVNSVIYGNLKENEPEKISGITKELIDAIIENPYLAEDDEDNYYNNVFEIAKSFESILDETYFSVSGSSNSANEKSRNKGLFEQEEKKDNFYLSLVSINLAKKFSKIQEMSNVLVLMSGTLHSEDVLRNIFGLKDMKVIDAETKFPGTISKFRTGLEKNCKHENLKNGNVKRSEYLKALSCCIANASEPILIHVTSFYDLPNQLEKAEYKVDNLLTREKLKLIQGQENREIENFKQGKTKVLFTTKCSRGVDFPGNQCNSVIITRYPYPDTESLFWKILRKEKPNEFLEFYFDKARRELLQKIYRAVRSSKDHVVLFSPDSRVLDASLFGK